jgi:hypothetical protein
LFFLLLILLIDKGGVGLLYIYRMVFTYFTLLNLRLLFNLLFLAEQSRAEQSRAGQKLTAGKQPARSHLASGPAGTQGRLFVQCKDLCFVLFFLSLILLIDKGGSGLLYLYIYIYRMVFYLLHLTPPDVTFPRSQGFRRMYINLVKY